MRNTVLGLFFLFSFGKSLSQNTILGPGAGLEYGGQLGIKISHLSESGISRFIGGGYSFNTKNVGVNVGLQYAINKDAVVHPFAFAMFGSNAAILIENVIDNSVIFKNTYFGPTFGVGVNIHDKRKNMWRISCSIPITSENFKNDFDEYKNAEDKVGVVTLGIGYEFKF